MGNFAEGGSQQPQSDLRTPSGWWLERAAWTGMVQTHHGPLTFDDHCRPIVKDRGSSSETEVTYDKQGKGRRNDFA
ncbi:hypothetical protein VTK26DRAFT_3205 [Humicola hyalothermophila]